jgi:hypothetical protein
MNAKYCSARLFRQSMYESWLYTLTNAKDCSAVSSLMVSALLPAYCSLAKAKNCSERHT